MLTEKEYVISSFENHFAHLKTNPIIIYGIGKNTGYILENFADYNIVGLMDEVRTGDTVFGKPVISCEEALKLGVKAIIIVARASNVKIIHRRIAKFTVDNAINVYDINGDLVKIEKTNVKSFEKYKGVSIDVLKAKIDRADIVSFDIFDTLIMRRCLYPRDIFYIIGEDFAKERIKAETELYSEGKHPNIYDIYEKMNGDYSPETEIELEKEYLIPRRSMIEILDYCRQNKKDVWLVSDMYLPKDIINDIFGKLNIQFEQENILVSCDCKVAKHNGLFDVLREKAGNGKILHIGDNYEADFVSAIQYNIDDAFHIENAVKMLDDSYASELFCYDNSLQNRLLIGEFISRQLNDPFLFGGTNGKFEINSHYDMSYSFIAPLVSRFFWWMTEKAKELNLDMILLSARDGYIIDKMYQSVKDKHDLPPMKYFYVSRAVAVIAGLIDDEDILYAAQLAYAGTAKYMLKNRFHLNDDEIMEKHDFESDDEYVLRHKNAILKVAEKYKNNYLRYINSLGIKPNAKIGFFDFVSSGTCQKGLTNIVDFELIGLYFAHIKTTEKYKSDIFINALLGDINVFSKNNYNFVNNYFFLENVLSSFEPCLSEFDKAGTPKFSKEYRTQNELEALKETHQAILDYFGNFYPNDLALTDKALADCIFKYIQSDYCKINTNYFVNAKLKDEFCNRNFEV